MLSKVKGMTPVGFYSPAYKLMEIPPIKSRDGAFSHRFGTNSYFNKK